MKITKPSENAGFVQGEKDKQTAEGEEGRGRRTDKGTTCVCIVSFADQSQDGEDNELEYVRSHANNVL